MPYQTWTRLAARVVTDATPGRFADEANRSFSICDGLDTTCVRGVRDPFESVLGFRVAVVQRAVAVNSRCGVETGVRG